MNYPVIPFPVPRDPDPSGAAGRVGEPVEDGDMFDEPVWSWTRRPTRPEPAERTPEKIPTIRLHPCTE